MASTCPTCNGSRRIQRDIERAWWQVILLRPAAVDELCPGCGGLGVVPGTPEEQRELDLRREHIQESAVQEYAARRAAVTPRKGGGHPATAASGNVVRKESEPDTKRDRLDEVFSYVADSDTLRLCKVLMRATNGTEAARAMKELCTRGDQVHRAFRDILSYGGALAKLNAARAVGILADTEAVVLLEDALMDSEWTVRLQAALALGKIGDRSALASLEKLLSMEDDLPAPIYRIGDRVVDNMHDHVRAEVTGAIEALKQGHGNPTRDAS